MPYRLCYWITSPLFDSLIVDSQLTGLVTGYREILLSPQTNIINIKTMAVKVIGDVKV